MLKSDSTKHNTALARAIFIGGVIVMPETNESPKGPLNALKDALRYVSEASYAILPEDVAHRLARLEKDFWGGVRGLVDKELEWIDERVAGSDRLREEWRCRRTKDATAGEGI
jgi:hypothetical protein